MGKDKLASDRGQRVNHEIFQARISQQEDEVDMIIIGVFVSVSLIISETLRLPL